MARAPGAHARPRPPPLAGLVLVLAVFAAGGCLNPIDPGTLSPLGDGVLTGYVRRGCGEMPLLAGAQVSLDGVVRAHTDDFGFYRIEGVKAGTVHTMAADLTGYVHTEVVVGLRPGQVKSQDFALETPGDASTQLVLDVLFVIDNTATMAARQAALVEALPAMASLVEQRNITLHVGFVTTDVGASSLSLPGCDPGGDQGVLQRSGLGATCDRAAIKPYSGDRFLNLYRDALGKVNPNYEGSLADALQCYAPQGTDGCRFPMPLEAMAQAFTNTLNGGFQQLGATLLVVIVTDKDDCSAPESTDLFDPFQTDSTSVLGPFSTYRCFEFGALCDGLPPGRNAGMRANCEAGTPDPRHALTSVADYAQTLADVHRAASGNDRVVVGVLAGPPSPVEVFVDGQGYSHLRPYCFVDDVGAAPAIRLNAFAATRPTPNDVICSDFSTALASWTQQALDLAAASRTCEP